MKTSLFLRSIATLALYMVFGLARAQDAEPVADPDPPDRAARLSVIRGDVSVQPAGEEDWAAAILNRPLTTGDKVWTDQGGRAEIQVGPAAVRLAENTGFSFLNVDDDTIQMRMTAGVISVTVRALDGKDHVEIDTPNIALSLLRPGTYRVEVNDPGDTTVVKVRDGEAEATGPTRDVVVRDGDAATFIGTDRVDARFARLGGPDEFDSWSSDRDRQYERVASSRTSEYVAPDVTGYEDLDDNGSWSSEPEYGYVWTPRYVAVDWAPYRYGRWLWVSPWGWTWIDDAPWGYAPFHYGRWAHVRERWCWVPGPRHVRAVYAPALVGWVDGPGGNMRIAPGGRVGWFPLGPREVYMPSRRFSRWYVERVNVSNTNVIRGAIRDVYERRARDGTYRNRGAVTVVERSTFTTAGRVGNRRVLVGEREVERTRLVPVAPRIAPERESRGGEARVNMREPPRTVADRQVVVRRNPPAPVSRFVARTVERRGDAPRQSSARPEVDRDRGRGRNDRPVRVERPAVDQVVSGQAQAAADRERTRDEERLRSDRPSRVRQEQDARVDRRDSRREEREDADVEHRLGRDEQIREQVQRYQREQAERQQVQQQFQDRQIPQQRREQSQRGEESERREAVRQTREREADRPRIEQRRLEQPRVEQPRVEQQRVEQPRVDQPRAERPRESQTQRPSESNAERRRDNEPRGQKR